MLLHLFYLNNFYKMNSYLKQGLNPVFNTPAISTIRIWLILIYSHLG